MLIVKETANFMGEKCSHQVQRVTAEIRSKPDGTYVYFKTTTTGDYKITMTARGQGRSAILPRARWEPDDVIMPQVCRTGRSR
jgi:hypothetical protein